MCTQITFRCKILSFYGKYHRRSQRYKAPIQILDNNWWKYFMDDASVTCNLSTYSSAVWLYAIAVWVIFLPPATKLRLGNIFTSVCQEFCPQRGVHGTVGGMCGRGHAWQGVCMAGGMHGRGVCMAGGMCGGGHAWWGDAWQGGHVWQGGMCGRKNGNCRGRYASYWNAFLFDKSLSHHFHYFEDIFPLFFLFFFAVIVSIPDTQTPLTKEMVYGSCYYRHLEGLYSKSITQYFRICQGFASYVYCHSISAHIFLKSWNLLQKNIAIGTFKWYLSSIDNCRLWKDEI